MKSALSLTLIVCLAGSGRAALGSKTGRGTRIHARPSSGLRPRSQHMERAFSHDTGHEHPDDSSRRNGDQRKALEVRPDELVVDVRRTSNPRLHAKGRTGIPRSDVSAIELF